MLELFHLEDLQVMVTLVCDVQYVWTMGGVYKPTLPPCQLVNRVQIVCSLNVLAIRCGYIQYVFVCVVWYAENHMGAECTSNNTSSNI